MGGGRLFAFLPLKCIPPPSPPSGVFQGPQGSNCPQDPAHIVVSDVAAAVEAALHRSRSSLWHSMR